MTRPWMGVTPAPRGQGYYPNEALPAYFAPAPPLTSNRFTFEEIRNPDSGETFVREYINDTLKREFAITDAVLMTTVVKLLREKGWTVTPPSADSEEAER